MPNFFESEALLIAVTETDELLGTKSAEAVIKAVPARQAEALNDALASLFADKRLSDSVGIHSDVSAPATADGLGWRLGSKVEGGVTRKMRFYRAQSVWKTQVGCLISIAIACALTPLNPLSAAGAIAPAFTLVSSAWDSLISLERPKDAHAIDAYKALLKAEIAHGPRPDGAPTATEIHAASDQSSLQETIRGLRRLKELNLVDVVSWEGESGVLDKPGNRWFQLF